MIDHLQAQRAATHARCWQQLPWWLNGTLATEHARAVELHLTECAICAAELELQRALQARLRDADPVTIAPQNAWQKMAQRLDDEDEALARGHFKLRPKNVSAWQWAVAAQALLIVGLVAWQQTRSVEAPSVAMLQPRYETLTAVADASIARDSMRVVFHRDATLTEVTALLRDLPVQIVAGPSEAGVYTLAMSGAASQASDSSEHAAAILKRLRTDARVIFAEPALRQ